MTVNIGNDLRQLAWGETVGANIVGTLKFGSTTAQNVTTFQNPVNLGGADRTVNVDDNPATGADYATMSGSITTTGTAGLIKSGPGTLYLSATNTYNGATTISGGALQATIGTGLPSGSFLSLDGGVFQSNGAGTFIRSLGTVGSAFQFTSNGGGFSAGTGSMTVNIGNDLRNSRGAPRSEANIVGTLKFGSTTAQNVTTFQNSINLNGGARTINVDDNAASSSDYAVVSGPISDSAGGGSLTKTGPGTLRLNGNFANTYSGPTTITAGALELAKTAGPAGYAIPGDLKLDSQNSCSVRVLGDNQVSPTATLTIAGGITATQEVKLLGHNLSVAGISTTNPNAVIENSSQETGVGNGTLTVNNAADCFYNGFVRDNYLGSGTLALVKTGPGTLTLSGFGISYSGGTTVSGGKLVLQDLLGGIERGVVLTNNATVEFNNYRYEYATFFTFNGAVSGLGSVIKSGVGTITFGGTSSNTYNGATTISSGTLILAKTSGYAIPGDFTISNGTTYLVVQNANQFPATAKVTLSGTAHPHFEMYGNTVTVGGISGAGIGVIENTEGESTPGNGTLIVNNSDNCSYGGYIRNTASGSGTLALVKSGAGTLTLTGNNCGQYTGGLTVNGGTLDYSGGTLPNCNYTVAGGTLNIGGKSQSIGTCQITGGTVSGTGTFTSNAAYDVQAGTIGVILAGSGIALNKTTAGLAVLSANNTYTGATTISAGTLQLGTGGAAGSVAGSIVINTDGTLDINRTSSTTFTSALSGTGTLQKTAQARWQSRAPTRSRATSSSMPAISIIAVIRPCRPATTLSLAAHSISARARSRSAHSRLPAAP